MHTCSTSHRPCSELLGIDEPSGLRGHSLLPELARPVRFVTISEHPSPEVVERTGSQTGERLWLVYDVPSADW